MKLWTSSWSLLFLVAATLGNDRLLVDTSLGKVKGYDRISRGGRRYMAFSGIAYARPPVGLLRFEPPVAPKAWTGIYNATEIGPSCLQYNTYDVDPEPLGAEDCLYLSVYTHNKKGLSPVLVHFHGGGFFSGTGPGRTKPDFLMDDEFVVVDINYRVGFLGFLSFEEERMPGNQGLKDQVAALRWVRANIARFGGDTYRVTIIGESAGAASVYHHTVSPMSRGLFNRAIAESGSSYNLWAVSPPGFARATARKLTELLGCPDVGSYNTLNCLKQRDGKTIQSALGSFRVWQIDHGLIFPCLEEPGPSAFLHGPISSWEHDPVPLLIGTTSGEGLLRLGYFHHFKTRWDWFDENFDILAPLTFKYLFTSSDPNKVTKELKSFYFHDKNITSDSWKNLTQLYSDSVYTMGIIDAAMNHPGKTYFYYFDYIGEYTYDKGVNRTLFFGAPHSGEAAYIWNDDRYRNNTFRGGDIQLSRRLVQMIYDFADWGDPTPRDDPVTWKPWDNGKYNYLEIRESGMKMREGFAVDRYKFWKTLKYNDLVK